VENDLVVLVEYQMQEPCSATGGKRWFSRIDDETWWTLEQEAMRVDRTKANVKASIKNKRPTHIPARAFFVVGGQFDGQWMTRDEIAAALGCSRDSIARDFDIQTGIYTFRQLDPVKSAHGRLASVAKKERAAGREYENTELRRRKWVSKTSQAFALFARLPVFN